MDRDMLFRHLEQRYTSKRDMISRVPLGVQPDALWQELLNQRRSKSTVLPLYSYKGTPYWYVTTDKMIAASEKIVEALYENDADYDPYAEPPTVSTLEEIFFTSYVEGSQMTIQAAMDFLTGGQPPRDIEEQLITNNRVAGSYASANLYRPIEAGLLRELITILTDGMDEGGQDYRTTETVDYSPADGEQFSFPSARTVPDRVGELSAFLASPQIHPLIKAAVAQAYMIILRPFPEGNERLGRVLSSMILLRAGYSFFSDVSLSALIARKSYTPARQHFPNGILPVFFRKGTHTDIALLARMAEGDVFPAGNGVTGLLHQRIEALKVVRFFRQCCIHVQAEAVTV